MNERVKNIIKMHWEQVVDGSYFYRGMSLKDLNLDNSIVLDPSQNPFKNITHLFMAYSELLFQLIEEGLEFNVNDFYSEPLQKILNWTLRDIKNPGIDFTTNYADAAAYAFNYAGSQLKHNLNLIVSTIHEFQHQKCFEKIDKQKFVEITSSVKMLLEDENIAKHQPVVVKVKRSCAAFQDEAVKELNFGSYDFFFKKVDKEARKNDSFNIDRIAFFLHQKSQSHNFNIRLIKPLYKDDIEEIIEL